MYPATQYSGHTSLANRRSLPVFFTLPFYKLLIAVERERSGCQVLERRITSDTVDFASAGNAAIELRCDFKGASQAASLQR